MPIRMSALPKCTGLEHLFVYDPRLGGEETPERKILWFYPTATPVAAQCNAVGLIEALGALMSTFGATAPCELLSTARRRHVVLRPEPHLWLVAVHVIAPPRGADVDEAASDETDAVMRAALRRFYDTLVLCCGPLAALRDAAGADLGPRRDGAPAEAGAASLRCALSRVAPLALLAANHRADAEIVAAGGAAPTGIAGPNSTNGVDDCGGGSGLGSFAGSGPGAYDLLSALDGVGYLPLDQSAFLGAQATVLGLLASHPSVCHALLSYSGEAADKAGSGLGGPSSGTEVSEHMYLYLSIYTSIYKYRYRYRYRYIDI